MKHALRDQQGATAISCSSWTLFGLSHPSTVANAIPLVNDWRMAAVVAADNASSAAPSEIPMVARFGKAISST